MAVFPDRIVLKRTTDSDASIRAAIESGGSDEIITGEIVMQLLSGAFRLYSLDANNNVVTIGSEGSNTIISTSTPSTRPSGDSLEEGDQWFNPSTGDFYIYYSSGWVQVSGSGGGGGGAAVVLPTVTGSEIDSTVVDRITLDIDVPNHNYRDLLIACITVVPGAGSLTAPDGWFLHGTYLTNIEDGGSTQELRVYKKLAERKEPSSYDWVGSASIDQGGLMVAIDGAVDIDSVVESYGNGDTASVSTDPDLLNLTVATWVYTSNDETYSQTGPGVTEITDSPENKARISGGYTTEGGTVTSTHLTATTTDSPNHGIINIKIKAATVVSVNGMDGDVILGVGDLADVGDLEPIYRFEWGGTGINLPTPGAGQFRRQTAQVNGLWRFTFDKADADGNDVTEFFEGIVAGGDGFWYSQDGGGTYFFDVIASASESSTFFTVSTNIQYQSKEILIKGSIPDGSILKYDANSSRWVAVPGDTEDVPTVSSTYIDSDSNPTTSLSLNAPSTVNEGELLVAAIMHRLGSNAPTSSSGFALHGTYLSLNIDQRISVYTKTATASEPGTYTWALSASGRTAGWVAALNSSATIEQVIESNGNGATATIGTVDGKLNLIAATWIYSGSAPTGYSQSGPFLTEITDSPMTNSRISGGYTTSGGTVTSTIDTASTDNDPNHGMINIILKNSASINDNRDVDTSTTPPTDGQALVWVEANGQWEPGDVSGGGGGGGVPGNVSDGMILNKIADGIGVPGAGNVSKFSGNYLALATTDARGIDFEAEIFAADNVAATVYHNGNIIFDGPTANWINKSANRITIDFLSEAWFSAVPVGDQVEIVFPGVTQGKPVASNPGDFVLVDNYGEARVQSPPYINALANVDTTGSTEGGVLVYRGETWSAESSNVYTNENVEKAVVPYAEYEYTGEGDAPNNGEIQYYLGDYFSASFTDFKGTDYSSVIPLHGLGSNFSVEVLINDTSVYTGILSGFTNISGSRYHVVFADSSWRSSLTGGDIVKIIASPYQVPSDEADGQVLTWNSSASAYRPADLSGSAVRLALGIGEYVDDTAAGAAGVASGAIYYNTTSGDYRAKS